MSLAWHVAALQRMKKLPKLDSMKSRRKPSKPQSWQDIKAAFKAINVASGGTFTTKKKAKTHGR